MSNPAKKACLAYCFNCKLRSCRVICADGTKSDEFVTARRGAKVIKALMEDGKIPRGEAFVLLITGGMVGLVPRNDELDEIVDAMMRERSLRDNPLAKVREDNRDAFSQLIDRLEKVPEKRTYH